MQITKLIGTIEKVRYLGYPKCQIVVSYTVDGSKKVYRHAMSKNFSCTDWNREEIHQLYKKFEGVFLSLGDGTRSKTIYDSSKKWLPLKFEIETFPNGHIHLRRLPSKKDW